MSNTHKTTNARQARILNRQSEQAAANGSAYAAEKLHRQASAIPVNPTRLGNARHVEASRKARERRAERHELSQADRSTIATELEADKTPLPELAD